jgi:two-component system sensor histidine kinase HydH
MEKVFEPLFTTKHQGTGLGLASCKQIIHEHQGTIHVENNPTTFVIKIPREITK